MFDLGTRTAGEGGSSRCCERNSCGPSIRRLPENGPSLHCFAGQLSRLWPFTSFTALQKCSRYRINSGQTAPSGLTGSQRFGPITFVCREASVRCSARYSKTCSFGTDGGNPTDNQSEQLLIRLGSSGAINRGPWISFLSTTSSRPAAPLSSRRGRASQSTIRQAMSASDASPESNEKPRAS